MNAPTYISGAANSWDLLATATPCGMPQFSAPIPGVKTRYVVKQEFMILKSAFVSQDLNTPYPDSFPTAVDYGIFFSNEGLGYENFLLVEESTPEDEGGAVKWTRTYAMIPEQNIQPNTITYAFIAFYPGSNTFSGGVLQPGRAGFSDTVPAEIVFDYALCPTPDDVNINLPMIPAQIYGFKTYPGGVPYPDYLTGGSIWPTGSRGTPDSSPTQEEYLAWVAAGTKIVAQPSTVSRWMGNIYCRQTIKILPQ